MNSKTLRLWFNILNMHTLGTTDPPQNTLEDTDEDVKFYLYFRSSPNTPLDVKQICKDCPVQIIVHGWLEDANREWYKNITREYLKKGEYNVILVDWSKQAGAGFFTSAKNVEIVGKRIAQFVVDLNNTYDISFKNFHIIGHSLGAHVAGHAGRQVYNSTGTKVFRITALDAAGPFFELPSVFHGLKKDDAEIVDAIHTDGGGFGYKIPFGHVDFYPNGGESTQPGCPKGIDILSFFDVQTTLDNLFCSHTRSYVYFIKSINEETYIASKCESWNLFLYGYCSSNLNLTMGDDYVHTSDASGSFFGYTSDNTDVLHESL